MLWLCPNVRGLKDANALPKVTRKPALEAGELKLLPVSILSVIFALCHTLYFIENLWKCVVETLEALNLECSTEKVFERCVCIAGKGPPQTPQWQK